MGSKPPVILCGHPTNNVHELSMRSIL